ncbi:uncharacterized protein LOC121652114 [Melanotaenia boesemani]|uniref:uncharacterized protein LOC121636965 n=1 Tax=Melanotaenia boesemani TaxID=1250792 RepID=UPI001C045A35|nr:uncharacterized protein LOC121636965 [Melanotaenia boesemani]XP_041860631.1 uncharacterized protein LOC121652114 [Melanotaenia boesemani]
MSSANAHKLHSRRRKSKTKSKIKSSMESTTNKKRKEKGGAEKARDKKKRNLDDEAAKCHKLTDMFRSSSSSSSASGTEPARASSSATAAPVHNNEGQRVELVEVPQTDTGQVEHRPRPRDPPSSTLNCFERPKPDNHSLDVFFSFHPQRNTKQLLVQRLFKHKDGTDRKDQVRKKRQVLERVVDVVKFIGKRGLSYRGQQSEAAYTLDDHNIDHGNFLELITLLGKYDSSPQYSC